MARGHETLRTEYSRLFASAPNLRATVSKQLISGNYVVLEEIVTGFPGVDSLKAVVIYEVRDSKIARVLFLP